MIKTSNMYISSLMGIRNGSNSRSISVRSEKPRLSEDIPSCHSNITYNHTEAKFNLKAVNSIFTSTVLNLYRWKSE